MPPINLVAINTTSPLSTVPNSINAGTETPKAGSTASRQPPHFGEPAHAMPWDKHSKLTNR